jgi:hypothetical protein
LAILFFAPFNESEQFGLHVQTTKLLSKPVSPIGWLCMGQCTPDELFPLGAFQGVEIELLFNLVCFSRSKGKK